jgi:glycosyltransferase involved in cell wall biosynthesis
MKRPKIFFIHNFFIDFRNPLFEKLSEKFDLTMLMTRETLKTDENMYQINYRKRPENVKYKIFSHLSIFSKYSLAWKIIPYLLFKEYDLIVSTDPHVSETWFSFLISKLRRKKFVIWTETFDWKRAPRARFIEPLVRLVCRYADACVAVGTKSREYFIKKGVSVNKIFIAPDTAQSYKIKKRVNDSDIKNKKIILYLSRIVHYKGLDILIKAFAKIEKEIKNSFLLIAGKGSFEQEAKDLAKVLNIKNIKFLGPVDKEYIGFYYSICDVFVLPSTFRDYDAECWGLVLNEAMAFGKPVVSTDAVGGACDLIKDGVNGFRVKHGNVEELYTALKKILLDDRLKKKMGEESRKLIKTRFNYENMSKGFEEAINYALSKTFKT